MATEQSLWRVNDVVAYDVMRELASAVQSRLLELTSDGDESARAELIALRRATFAVDGYDRAAVETFTLRLQQRDTELASATADDR
jgi:hypothetical protein